MPLNRDITIVYITSNKVKDKLGKACREQLVRAATRENFTLPIISVSKKPIDFGENIVFEDQTVNVFNIFKQVYTGVQEAQTKYIAIAEDDVLYSPSHFEINPREGVFTFNVNNWHIYPWLKPIEFSSRFRMNNYALVCPRDLYLKAMGERFAAYPDESQIKIRFWSTPGRYEKELGVPVYDVWEDKGASPPNVVFLHKEALQWSSDNGKSSRNQKPGPMRAYDVPYWGRADELVKLLED